MKTTIRLYTSDTTYLDFADDSIVELSWEQQSTTDYSKPIYDIYPLSGHVVIKDKDLTLYNKAINGEFDQYDYPVEVIVGDKYYEDDGFAVRFYINALPEYSYEDKTLTLSLSDKLAKADELTYSGYDYPFEPQTLYTIARAVLKSFDSSLEETDLNNILPDSFKQITIEYPYIPDNISYRQAFRQILTVAQMSLISDYILRYIFVNMDGHKDISLIYKTAILSNQMLSQFIPSIILANRYNVAEIASKQVSVDYHENSVITNVDNIADGVREEADNSDTDTSNSVVDVCYSKTGTAGAIYSGTFLYITYAGTKYQTVYKTMLDETETTNFPIIAYFPQKLGLKDIFSVTKDDSKSSPYYEFTLRKIVTRIKGTLTANWTGTTYSIDKNSFVATDTEENVSDEILYNQPMLDNIATYKYSSASIGSVTVKGKQVATLRDIATYDQLSKSFFIDKSIIISDNEHSYYFAGENGSGYYEQPRYDDLNRPINSAQIVGYKYTVKYSLVKLTVSYRGNFTEVKFNDDTTRIKLGTATKENKVAITMGGELMQYSSSTSLKVSLPQSVANNTLNVFKNGLRGGEVEVIAWDYYAFDKNASGNYNKIINYLAKVSVSKFFPIGQPVIPCKDQDRTPIMTKLVNNVATPVIFMVVKNAITFNGGTFTQRLTLREVVE